MVNRNAESHIGNDAFGGGIPRKQYLGNAREGLLCTYPQTALLDFRRRLVSGISQSGSSRGRGDVQDG